MLQDSLLVHPLSFCSLCYGIVRRTTAALDSGSTYTPASTPHFHWEPHFEQGCSRVRCCSHRQKGEKNINPPTFWFLCFKVCEHFHTLLRGGRGQNESGRPKGIAVVSLLQIWLHLEMSKVTLDQKLCQNEHQFAYYCLTDHWTHCVAQLCVLNVSVNGFVPVTHLLVPFK